MNKLAFSLALFFIWPGALVAASIERIDPPNWWAGMHNQDVQLLIHGEGIGGYEVKLDSTDVSLQAVDSTDNANYLFATLKISPSFNKEFVTLKFEKPGQEAIAYQYPIFKREPNSAQRAGFGNRDLIYLITPDRFANGDTSNDAFAEMGDELNRSKEFSRHGGDLQGIINHLDYLEGLGVTQLWLNPVLENKQPKSSYHGYAITDHYKVDPRYGDNALYKKLAKKAKQNGIGLIIDLIPNHIGHKHWWMTDLPSNDWINFNNTFSPTNHMRESVQDPYAVEADRKQFADGWFVASMPDLNQRNPLLANYLIQNAIWWVETANLTGIRIDTWSYSNKLFLSQWSDRILAEYPQLNMVGEEWSTTPNIIAYWQKGAINADGYASNLPSLFDFPLQASISPALIEDENWNTGLIKLYKTLASDAIYPNPSALTIFADNHDMSRVMTQVNGDATLNKMALTLIATLRGTPQIFYGSEIAMQHPGTESHGAIRADFPGGWVDDSVNAFAGKNLTQEQSETLAYVRQLFNWRKSANAIHTGQMHHLAPKDGVYCFTRFNAQERWLICLNKNTNDVTLPFAQLTPLLDSGKTATHFLSQEAQNLTQGLRLKARAADVFRIQ
ncbi:glycoside hydrolase family 13 protein [Simiduia curdlanivorans]|uniref:Glycoside hydrolase family 13 protein n=1 Tax=Simiduia curdlanivorans TaxID=1492769 RepID=A0ABV8V5I1_9GAMM|nr:glycoside hydrolase family 13 protein [Simiduia curdlanivorans]MDN3638222.1 glycoside hydrolase family 13 protein [Simiduia curdlanivorans]